MIMEVFIDKRFVLKRLKEGLETTTPEGHQGTEILHSFLNKNSR